MIKARLDLGLRVVIRRFVCVCLLLIAACRAGQEATTTAPPADPATSATTANTAPDGTTVPTTTTTTGVPLVTQIEEYPVPAGSHPHDVAPAPDGTIWYTGQNIGVLGRLDPVSGDIDEIPLGDGSAPHGVIIGPDGAAWVTDGGLNAIVRVDENTSAVDVYPLPGGDVNLNTAVFDHDGILWFTGQGGVFGRLDPASPEPAMFEAPDGRGPYGITVTPNNEVFYASLAGNHIARIDKATGAATRIDPPTPGQGSRRVWSDNNGMVWVSEWEAGQVGVYDPMTGSWREWVLPGDAPQAYAVYVDETDRVWLTDFAGDGAVVRFDPTTESFESFPLPTPAGNVRQLLGRPGEVWGAESAADALIVFRYGS